MEETPLEETTMEQTRRRGIVISVCFILFLAFIAGYEYMLRPPTWMEGIAALMGILIGVLLCAYIHTLWDPVTLKPVHPDPETEPWWRGCQFPMAVMGGPLLASLVRMVAGERAAKVSAAGVVAWLLTILTYFLIVYSFWHRPRKGGQ